MKYRYYICRNGKWFECSYSAYANWKGKKYKASFNVLECLNSGKIKID